MTTVWNKWFTKFKWGIAYIGLLSSVGSFLILGFDVVKNSRFSQFFPTIESFAIPALLAGGLLCIVIGELHQRFQLKTDSDMMYSKLLERMEEIFRRALKEEKERHG